MHPHSCWTWICSRYLETSFYHRFAESIPVEKAKRKGRSTGDSFFFRPQETKCGRYAWVLLLFCLLAEVRPSLVHRNIAPHSLPTPQPSSAPIVQHAVPALSYGAAVSATPSTSSSSMEEMARPSSSPTPLPKTPAKNLIYKYAEGSNVKRTRYLSSPNTPSAHLTSPSKVPRASAKNPIFEHVEGVKRGNGKHGT